MMDLERFIDKKLELAVNVAMRHGKQSDNFRNITEEIIEAMYSRYLPDFCRIEPHITPINPGAVFQGGGSRYLLFTSNDSKVYVLVTNFDKCFTESSCEFGICEWGSVEEFLSNMKKTECEKIFVKPKLSLNTLKRLYETEYEKLHYALMEDYEKERHELLEREVVDAKKALNKKIKASTKCPLKPGECQTSKCNGSPVSFVVGRCARHHAKEICKLDVNILRQWNHDVTALLSSKEFADARRHGVV